MIRDQVIEAFDPENHYFFSQVLPRRATNYIDGLFHIGMLAGAAQIVGDGLVAAQAKCWIMQLLLCGNDARNFANSQVTEDWKYNETQGLWVKHKPQSFAGPAAIWWANKHGASIPTAGLPNPMFKAKVFCMLGRLFGHAVKYISWLRQHVNSMFLAYLLLGKKPPASMAWLAYDNPFYRYIYGIKDVVAKFPDPRKYNRGKRIYVDEYVDFKDREPDSWPAKNWPYAKYTREGEPLGWQYTPICELVTYYLQGTL